MIMRMNPMRMDDKKIVFMIRIMLYIRNIAGYNCVRVYTIRTSNLFNPELQLINAKSVIKSKLKDLFSELKQFKVQTVSVLENKKIDDHKSMPKIFQSSAKLIVKDSNLDKAFTSMHQSVMTKIKNSFSEDWIVKIMVEHDVQIFEC